jgi:hypothetical protein
MLMMTAMIMVVIVIMTMRMVVRRRMMRIAFSDMRMPTVGIGAAFRIERRFDLDHAGAEALHHRLNDMIAPDAQTSGGNLGRQMAVAKMPGDPDQMVRILSSDFDQRLRGRHDFDQPAILEHQRITAAQRDRVFQIKQERQAPRARHRHPSPVPIVEIEHDGIGWRCRPAILTANLRRADHLKALTASRPCRR